VLPGEEVDVEFVVRGVGKDRKGDVNISIAGEVVDSDGKKVRELLPTPITGPPYSGGSTLASRVSFELSPEQFPGAYTVRARLADKVTGRVADFVHPVYVLRPEFGAVRLRLTHDKDGAWPAGANLTVGQQFFVQGRVVNYARDGDRVQLAIKVSARDRDGKETTPAPVPPSHLDQEVKEGSKINFDRPLRTVMAGEVVITVELEDLIGKKKASYELPVVIHPPRSVPLRPFTKER
jgi:hypothetical protein